MDDTLLVDLHYCCKSIPAAGFFSLAITTLHFDVVNRLGEQAGTFLARLPLKVIFSIISSNK
jgi:hypothetical protein